MDYGMYVMFNNMTGFYEGISLFRTDAQAAHRFSDAASKAGVDLSEYKLFRLGLFDILTAKVKLLPNPELIPFITKGGLESEMKKVDVKE